VRFEGHFCHSKHEVIIFTSDKFQGSLVKKEAKINKNTKQLTQKVAIMRPD